MPAGQAPYNSNSSGGGVLDNIVSDIGGFFSNTLDQVSSVYDHYTNVQLAGAAARASQSGQTYVPNTAQPTPVVYQPTTNAAPAGPMAGVSTQTMVLLGGAAIVALLLLRK